MTAHEQQARLRREVAFWGCVLALVALKLVLVADLTVQINYSPHDDSLYVERAYYLLLGEAFGPYDSRTLLKFPGLTLWLVGTRLLEVPFLVSVNAAYLAAGAYLAWAFLRAGVGRWVVLAAFAVYVFNPATLGFYWIRVIREPLSSALFVVLGAAMLHSLVSVRSGRRPWVHLFVFSVVFAFSVFFREEDRLLWGLLPLFAAAVVWSGWPAATRRAAVASALVAIVVPAALAKGYEYELRAFVERHYGLPIIHEFTEGEFPRLMAAIRSIDSSKNNRLVIATQDRLAKLASDVPEFRIVVEHLPPVGKDTFSCQLHGVCTEWSNGWMPFWIRDEAWRAGFMKTLPEGQAYFRQVRTHIEELCQSKKLACTPDGQGLVAPFHLRWTKALVLEAWRLTKVLFAPDPLVVDVPPKVYNASAEMAEKFQVTTLTRNTATEWKAAPGEDVVPVSTRGSIRVALVAVLRPLFTVLLICGLVALLRRLWRWDPAERGPLETAAVLLGLYCALRFAALSYVAVYLGTFDSRIMFSAYTAGIVFSVVLIAHEVCRWQRSRAR